LTPSTDVLPISRDALAELLSKVAVATRWLSVADAATHAALSVRSIRQLLAAGKLTAHRPVRGKIVIDRVQLDNYISSSTAAPRKGRGR
jgi:excisionase family DNA binding protein